MSAGPDALAAYPSVRLALFGARFAALRSARWMQCETPVGPTPNSAAVCLNDHPASREAKYASPRLQVRSMRQRL